MKTFNLIAVVLGLVYLAYVVGVSKHSADGQSPQGTTQGVKAKAYLARCLSWGEGIKRVLNDDGALFLNVRVSPSNRMLPHEIAAVFSDGVFTLQNTIYWIKSISLDGDDDEESIARAPTMHFGSLRLSFGAPLAFDSSVNPAAPLALK